MSCFLSLWSGASTDGSDSSLQRSRRCEAGVLPEGEEINAGEVNATEEPMP